MPRFADLVTLVSLVVIFGAFLQAEQEAIPILINITKDLKQIMDTDDVEQRWQTENVGFEMLDASLFKAEAGICDSCFRRR